MDIIRALVIFDVLMGADEWQKHSITQEQAEQEQWDALHQIEISGILPSLPQRYKDQIYRMCQEDDND